LSDDTSAQTGSAPALADFTCEALILPQLQARDLAGAILELSRLFPLGGPGWDAVKLNRLALEREQQMSTAMPFGAAFPHVRANVCPRLQFALGRSAKPFAWGGRGAPEVRFVFLNAVPAGDAMGYLKLVSAMARLGKDPTLLERFKTAAGAGEILGLLRGISVRK
jgi:mannitol/fructose-specific phosphotransferase system IIA component (Ntr-type)